MLGTNFYLHNVALPMCRNARYPANNARDTFIGFVLVYLTNIICGCIGYIGFSGYSFTSMPGYKGITDNCLYMFSPTDIKATIARVCLFTSLISSTALVVALERS